MKYFIGFGWGAWSVGLSIGIWQHFANPAFPIWVLLPLGILIPISFREWLS